MTGVYSGFEFPKYDEEGNPKADYVAYVMQRIIVLFGVGDSDYDCIDEAKKIINIFRQQSFPIIASLVEQLDHAEFKDDRQRLHRENTKPG